MDYTPDFCMNQFTREQGNRLVCALLNYRPDLATVLRGIPPGVLGLLLKLY